ncbi:MAG: trimethylamine methyltransferase family protein, partial [Thermoleophilia bacterium]|nr:trimethylamine methyltransferase family protein [Thermoleophilia bacterium]
LEERGATVDRESGMVRMPPDLVRASLAQLPDRLVLAGATPERDVVLDRHTGPFFNPSGCHAKTLDFRTGKVRQSTLQDIREGTAVMDATPEIDFLWTFATANDVPVEHRELTEYHAYLSLTSKPLVFVDCPTEVEPVRRIMDVLGDGMDGFRRRPRIAILCAVRAPLQVNGELLDATCAYAEMGAPVWAYTMPMAGATSPVTVGGTLALMWAEILGMVTAVQATAPGAAVLACCGPGVLDMRTSSMSLGSPENTIMGIASVEIGHHLGLPVHNSALSTDAKHPGVQAGYEKGLKVLPAALAGVDVISGGFGALASSSVWHLPMVPIDADIARLVRHIIAGADISVESVMSDAIARLGAGGNYLKERVTRERTRAGEHFSPVIGSRLAFEQWMAAGVLETDVAREIVDQVLATGAADAADGRASALGSDQLAALAEVCGVQK